MESGRGKKVLESRVSRIKNVLTALAVAIHKSRHEVSILNSLLLSIEISDSRFNCVTDGVFLDG